jgi:hypothetical protein
MANRSSSAVNGDPEMTDGNGCLTGSDEGHQPDQFLREFAYLPQSLSADPRFAKHQGKVAQNGPPSSLAALARRQ